MNLCKIRLDRERLFINENGAREIIALLQQIAEVAVSLGEIGIERYGLLEFRGGFVEPKSLTQDVAGGEMRPRRVRPLCRNCDAELERFFVTAKSAEDFSGAGMCFDEKRIEPARFQIRGK